MSKKRAQPKRMLVSMQVPTDLVPVLEAAMRATGYSGGQIAGECLRAGLVKWASNFMKAQAEAKQEFEALTSGVKVLADPKK